MSLNKDDPFHNMWQIFVWITIKLHTRLYLIFAEIVFKLKILS